MIIKAEIVATNDDEIFLKVPKPFDSLSKDILVELDDGRQISAAQRRKVYALLNCISEHTGYTPIETIKEMLKLYYLGWTGRITKVFSLSNCSMETASDFITFLIDFCLSNQVKCNEPLQSLCDDLEKYIYSCLMNKTCCVCGKKADLHHCTGSRVGMGNDRKEMYQIGAKVLPLCRKCHTEIHTMPEENFFKKYHICCVPLTDTVAKKYRLTKKARGLDGRGKLHTTDKQTE